MENLDILSTAAESVVADQLEPIEPSDLTVSNLKKLFEDMLPGIRTLAFNIIVCIVIYVVGKKIIHLIRIMVERALTKAQADIALVRFLSSAVESALRIFLLFMILGQLGINTASIVTVLGTLMLAIGMSLQGSLSNVAGGILLLLTRPFKVGNYIITSYGEGAVTMIGLVYTTLTTKDNCVLTIPNSQISNCAITNCGGNPQRRLDTIVGISYSSDIAKAKEILQRISEESEYVLHDRPVSIFVDSLADSSVNLGMNCYVESSNYLAAKWQITETIKKKFDEGGIEIPFPQVHVHMEK